MRKQIYNENCLDTMARMSDNYVDLTVTSPPYDNLRTYKGYIFDFENIAKELYRITKDGGVVVWVVADQTSKFCESLSSFKQAIYFVEECGFNLLDTMIYAKKQYPPAYPTLRRYANQFEYMFIFSKGRPNTFNTIKEPKADSTILRLKYPRIGAYRQKDGTLKRNLIKCKDDKLKSKTNLWTYAVSMGNSTKDKIAFKHPAIFPEQLANDHIISWSNENDLVYDPFMGSGTTAKMAILNNRNYIGSEIAKEYCEIAKKRLDKADKQLHRREV